MNRIIEMNVEKVIGTYNAVLGGTVAILTYIL